MGSYAQRIDLKLSSKKKNCALPKCFNFLDKEMSLADFFLNNVF